MYLPLPSHIRLYRMQWSPSASPCCMDNRDLPRAHARCYFPFDRKAVGILANQCRLVFFSERYASHHAA